MLPTLNEMGDIVLVDRLSPRWAPIQRGDVVVAESSYKLSFAICKRVVGLPGDVVHPPLGARARYGGASVQSVVVSV
jgi:inner membrane protease subunit 1